MRIGWLCPFVDDPKSCVGAVIETDAIPGTQSEYIPVILPETPLDDAMAQGPLWVLSMVADPCLVFGARISAEGFLFDTFQAFLSGALTPLYVEYLLDKWNGYPREASEYGLVIPLDRSDLN